MEYLESDPELMALMEESIRLAHEINPDPDTNPVDTVESFYDFLDWAVTCMPWNVLADVSYPTLYDHIDQSVDYIWFLLDQPLQGLKEKDTTIPPCSIMTPSPPGAGNTRTSGEPSSPLRRAGTIFTTSVSKAIPA